MRAYLITSGVIFLLILVAHGARVAAEGTWLATEPSFVATSGLALGMFVWACVLFRRSA